MTMEHLQCLGDGGHHWEPQVPGERNTCRNCGYKGLVFEKEQDTMTNKVGKYKVEVHNDTVTLDIDGTVYSMSPGQASRLTGLLMKAGLSAAMNVDL
ncbi:hypothetical protein BH789_gp113 [Gordonia phage GMA6]|uniref:Uncharacterized protein n=1 Tax=Gordonia phage GMA6 TaxID=1647285 RepID=A0A0K0NLB2_9CAUD|nr:hypothetical protein BH789_gp113 [Gordonia phage GMA6]AKL88394.1 hypothetical protein GMA6_113 [Gordonia phage GMA6]